MWVGGRGGLRFAHGPFTRALVDLAARGLRTHCSDAETHHLWLSEEAHERAVAARLCRGCPALTECGEAAEARRERFGVWGGRDRTLRSFGAAV